MKKAVLISTFAIFHFLLFAQQKDSMYNTEMKLPDVKMITVFGKYKVWTRKVGNGKIKLLLLQGGPGNTHVYLEGLADYLAQHGVEVYLYDQLGNYFSDQPKIIHGDTIWKMPMRVEEVEEVRKGLGLEKFYLIGHSYGAGLGLAYTHKYPQNVKGYIFSSANTDTISFQARIDYVSNQIDSMLRLDTAGKEVMKQIDGKSAYDTSKYAMLSAQYFQDSFTLRTRAIPALLISDINNHTNHEQAAEILASFYQSDEFNVNLTEIKTPVLLIAGKYDFTVSETNLQNMHKKLSHSRVFVCPKGGHMVMLDSPDDYFPQILKFLYDVETEKL
jgi:proline iminopeptidase